MNAVLQSKIHWTPSDDDRNSGRAIPRPLRDRLETVLRCDLSSVRLSVDPSLARVDALAAAQGDRIRLSPWMPRLDTPAGVVVLGHELAHVMQQRQGRVHAVGPAVVDDAALEREADQAGLHCAAIFFPDAITDPGFPEALRGGAHSQDKSARAPIQFVVSAKTSFDDVVVGGYKQLDQNYRDGRSDCETILRDICYDYHIDREDPVAKKTLEPIPFCQAMLKILGTTQDNLVQVQGWSSDPWPYLPPDRGKLVAYFKDCESLAAISPQSLWPPTPAIGVYTAQEAKKGPEGTLSLDAILDSYVHVFVMDAKRGPANWRISLNVSPKDIAGILNSMVAIMAKYPAIEHMKFAVPTINNKPDGMIAYMNSEDPTFTQARQDIIEFAKTLPLQPRVGAMMNEIIDGLGEGAEAPDGVYYSSFTDIRCKAMYVAFKWMVDIGTWNRRSLEDFQKALVWVMKTLGLNTIEPQMQKPFYKWPQGMQANLVRQVYLNKANFI